MKDEFSDVTFRKYYEKCRYICCQYCEIRIGNIITLHSRNIISKNLYSQRCLNLTYDSNIVVSLTYVQWRDGNTEVFLLDVKIVTKVL